MKPNKYQSLDDAICEVIRAGRGHPTHSSNLEGIARFLIASGIGGRSPFPVAWRLIDRRMQTMRKDGRIVYDSANGGVHGRWRVVDA